MPLFGRRDREEIASPVTTTAGSVPPVPGDPRGPTVSGVSALSLLAFGVGVVVLAWWAGNPDPRAAGGRTIQGLYGFPRRGRARTAGLVLRMASSTIPISCKATVQTHRAAGQPYEPVGLAFTYLDHALVFGIANACGAGSFTAVTRSFQFAGYFGTSILVAGFTPAPWGLIGVVAALFGVFALNRKWAWVEDDRRAYMLSGAYDVQRNSNLSIGFEGDYRGVALTALALLIVIMPLALMQSSAFGFFELKNGGDIRSVSPLEWFIFFGGEMAKSVPFVDWSEVYGAETVTPLRVVRGGGQHTVFFVRAIVDLVLLSGLIQVLDLSSRLARQEANFRDDNNPERLLDPFMERDAFKDIARLAAPAKEGVLEAELIGRMSDELGAFKKYSNQQIQRVLWFGQAPTFWRPDHESAAAIILPHRGVAAAPPQFFSRIITEGMIAEAYGDNPVDRKADERTVLAAAMSALATSQANWGGFARKSDLHLTAFRLVKR